MRQLSLWESYPGEALAAESLLIEKMQLVRNELRCAYPSRKRTLRAPPVCNSLPVFIQVFLDLAIKVI
jgi:hypothetical protein